MNGRGADGIGGPIQEFWTVRDIVGRVGVLGMVEGTQLIGHGRGRVGRAASMDSEMGQHVGVSSLQPRCVDLGVEMRGKAWPWSRPEQQQQRPKPWGPGSEPASCQGGVVQMRQSGFRKVVGY